MTYASIQKILQAVCISLLIGLTGQSALAQSSQDALVFDPFPKGASEDIVKKIWSQNPDYQNYIRLYNTVPDHMLATADLNGDNNPEIFARHSDPEGDFCKVGTHACLLLIYTINGTNSILIGEIISSGPVIVLPKKTMGYNDLLISDVNRKLQTYTWNGKTYVQS